MLIDVKMIGDKEKLQGGEELKQKPESMNKKIIPVSCLTSWEVGGLHLKIRGKPLTKSEFSLLRQHDIIYPLFDEVADDSELPAGWYITDNYEELEKLGFMFEAKVKERINKYREYRRRADEMRSLSESFDISCPKCHEKLVAATWNDKRAVLRCFRHDFSAIVDRNGVIDQGFDEVKNKEYGVILFWYNTVFRFGSIKKAKAEISGE